MDNKKVVQGAGPPALVQMRRKSGGGGDGPGAAVSGIRRRSGPQGLRSPAAKRPLSAPVALQGWLHKQGSEGLMLWKKRWFVLSEYCLFYYKGPEEEKLLGSILLPSYRVTACRPEDKANRKFAFKAEHANMRTYHFAADSRETMNHWVNALTLASLLQDPNPGGGEMAAALDLAGPADGERSARPSVSSISSILNQSADDSDSGFHGFQSRDDPSHASNNNSSPNSANTASFPISNNANDNQPQPVINGWMQQSPQYGQPGASQQQGQQQQQAQHVQYAQIPGPSHQHQPQIHQHVVHQSKQPQQQQQQQQQPQQQQQQQQQNSQAGPSNVQTVQPMQRNFGQPLYANAPPKPRRLTDGSNEYSTPSPDLDSTHQDFRKSPVSPDVRVTTKSPGSEYDRGSVIYVTRMTQPPQTLRTDKSGLNYGYAQSQPTERRTPDTYGRSAKPRSSRGNGDYEDVYGAPQLYQRPAGPVGYTKGPAPAPIPIPVYVQQHPPQRQQIYAVLPAHTAPVMRQPRAQPPPRPHSADFLEYEATRRPQQQTQVQPGALTSQQRRPQRPKSSLDVVNPSDVPVNDGYFYSEERYAAQMRQSAVYLHQTPQHHQQQRNQSLSRAATPSKTTSSRERDTESVVGSISETSTSALRRSQREQNATHQQHHHIISSHSLQRHTEITNESLVRRSLRERSYDQSSGGRELLFGCVPGEGATVPRRIQRDSRTEYDTSTGGRARRWSEQQFARSASARLPRTRHQVDRDEDDYAERSSGQDSRDGERKTQQREESMKRLLEWKQRMLQSPLTRKPPGSANRGIAQNELSSYYKQQAFLELAAHEASVAEARHSRRRDEGHRTHPRSKSTDGRRSVNNNVSRYNSYSSDDEASGSGSVIGRDPLPPRAISTSQLPQRTLTQPPLPRGNAHQQQPHPIQQTTLPLPRPLERTAAAASVGDVRTISTGEARITSPGSGQLKQEQSVQRRMASPAGPLRVISPNGHRVSSPNDSDSHSHSPVERTIGSPVGRDFERIERGVDVNGHGRQTHRTTNNRDNNELLNKGARLVELDTPRRLQNLQKLEELQKHLMDLEKQHEKGKPMVNLVDNMVKLGSLYNRGTATNCTVGVSGSRPDLVQEKTREVRDRLEFNQRVQEQRLLAEERRDWERLSPDHGQLQAKVQQLYKLDRLLQEESGTLHSLQQDKEILEKALGGLRNKLQGSRSNPAEVERYRKQQLLLERELSRVRLLLAHNSKKLEETVAENARLEQELVVLRQKLQASRRYAGNVTRDPSGTTAALEAEMRRVQQLVGDLQRQRQELSIQVRQLTEKSHSLVQQIRPQHVNAPQVHHRSKKRSHSSWLETDLDSGMTLDHGLDSPASPISSSGSPHGRQNGTGHPQHHNYQPHHHHHQSSQYKETPGAYKDHIISSGQYNNQSYNHPNVANQQQQQQQQQQRVSHSPQNQISALSPQLREQIHQHQLKQQQLREQMQGKASPVQNNVQGHLYVNTDSRRQDTTKHQESNSHNAPAPPPEYVPPPPPPPTEEALINGNYAQNEESKFAGLIQNREKQEIKTVRIVKRESERRQRDRGDRTGNIGIPITNGLQVPGGAKRLNDDDFGGSQQFEKGQLDRVTEESAMIHAQSTVQLSEIEDVQFQRSMSLPRGFGGQRTQPGTHQGPVLPPPRSDSMNAIRNMMVRRHRVRFENQDGNSDGTLSPHADSPSVVSQAPLISPTNYPMSPAYGPNLQNSSPVQYSRGVTGSVTAQQHMPAASQYYPQYVGPEITSSAVISTGAMIKGSESSSNAVSPTAMSPPPSAHERLFGSAASINSLHDSPQLSPVFKSEAAKQIIKEMAEKRAESGHRRRPVPKEKRRHYTVSSSKPILDLEDTFSKMGMGRARDDLDMERALRPRINAPDVVRSTLNHKELKYNESTIDNLLGTPNKILIPERYIPEQTPELTAEEQEHRLKKAESIRKMLSETTVTALDGGEDDVDQQKSNTLKKKVAEEKRQREHILQLNQILAKLVMEKSKMVAVKALATLPLQASEPSFEEDDLSPVTPLPLYQQRENFYS